LALELAWLALELPRLRAWHLRGHRAAAPTASRVGERRLRERRQHRQDDANQDFHALLSISFERHQPRLVASRLAL
jgi:hypothetical protein